MCILATTDAAQLGETKEFGLFDWSSPPIRWRYLSQSDDCAWVALPLNKTIVTLDQNSKILR